MSRKERNLPAAGRMQRRWFCLGLILWLAAHAYGQTSSLPIEVDVKDFRLYAGWAPGGPDSFASALGGVPGLLVNSQGGSGVQSDLSIRGSSYSGAGLSVGGLALVNPQTEHFNTELPLPSMLFLPPRTLTGLDEVLGSSGHLVGSVDLEFRPMSEYGRVAAGVGESQRSWQELFYNHVWKPADEERVGVGVFGSREQAESVDYDDNDLDRWEGGAHLQLLGKDRQMDAVVAHQDKDFGARGYYGVSPEWYADEAMDDTFALVGSRWGDLADQYVRATALWRSSWDQYRLFMDPSDVYENQHRSRTAAISADGRVGLTAPVSLNWQLGAESEAMDSVSLGDHSRRRGDLLLLPELAVGRTRVSAGAKACVFSGESPDVLPQTGVKFAVTDRHSLFASYTESVRQPSYTELNYESPASLGNSGLQRQEAENVEAGWRWSRDSSLWCQLAVFDTRSQHTVDWVKDLATSLRWVATDLGRVDTRGVEVSGQYQISDRLGQKGAYPGLNKQYEGDYYAGRYVLDYPRHLIQMAGEWRCTSSLRATVTQSVRWQEPMEARREDDVGSDGRIAIQFCPQKLDGVEVALACDNVWNDNFQAFVDQPVAGRRYSLSVAWSWK